MSKGNKSLAVVSVLNIAGFLLELVGGFVFGSIALISDSFHMLFDAFAYIIAYSSTLIAERYEESDWSYGAHRVEPLAAFVNGILLIPIVGFIIWESYQRFLSPIEISAFGTLVVAIIGLMINIISVIILEGDDMSLNERGAFYHLLGDVGGSIAVVTSVLVIQITGVRVVDPIVASLIVALILWSAIKILSGSSAIFLHKSPVNTNSVKSDIVDIDGVKSVTDIHVWQICSQIIVATAHIETNTNVSSKKRKDITNKVHRNFSDYSVDHATVEICTDCNHKTGHLIRHSH